MTFSITQNSVQASCLIVGGGISGLMAATVLQNSGVRVTVLDKGRGIGGRLATRRIRHPIYGEGIFDYGAQLFTALRPEFQFWVDQWQQQGVITTWFKTVQETTQAVENRYYRGSQSNRGLAQHLAQNLHIETQTRVTKIIWESERWHLWTEDGRVFEADTLILTAPLPQTLTLLQESAIALPSPIQTALESITYDRCISILALLQQPSSIPEPGGLRLQNSPLAWIACNQKKGISPQGVAVTLHATDEFSRNHWESEDAAIAALLFDSAAPWISSPVVEFQLHRWRYSQPQTCYAASHVTFSEPGLGMIAGDAFWAPDKAEQAQKITSHLEQAVLSGMAAAHDLLQRLRVLV